MRTRTAALCLTLLAAACVTNPRPPGPQLPPPLELTRAVAVTILQPNRQPVPGLACSLQIDLLDPLPCTFREGRAFFAVPITHWGFGATLHFAADGFLPYDSARFVLSVVDLAGAVFDDGTLVGERFLEPRPTYRQRRGVPRLAGRTLIDDDGPYLGIGASCMWCVWGYDHDRARLIDNLKFLADHGVDYIRVLGTVGPTSWSDRTVDARAPSLPASMAGLTDLAYDRFGLRVEWTIFGGIETAPSDGAQRALVAAFLAASRGREHKIQHWEIANEGTNNGFGGDDGRALVWSLAQLLRAGPNLVALTAPVGADAREWYDGSPATLRTEHLDRNITGTGGMFRPVRQARELVDQPLAWSSNEPIGIDSSVASDADPTRLVLSAIYTWLCRGSMYVAHSGAGIRGGGIEDLNRGRRANYAEQPTFASQLDGMRAIRAALPADLPNFARWENGNSSFPGYPFNTDPIQDEGNVLRAFCAIAADQRFVCVPIDVQRPTPFTARRPMTFDVLDPLTAAVRSQVTLEAGQTYLQQPTAGAVMIGRLR